METAPVRVTRTVHLDVDRDTAWRLIGTQDGLARWLGGDVVLDPTEGAALRVVGDDGATRTGRVLSVDEGRSLTFEWGDGDDERSTVTLTVEGVEAVEGADGADGALGASRVTVVEQRAGGSVAACADAGAAWDDRLVHLELGALVAVPAFAGGGPGDLLV